ncbi:nitroreductase family protein [Flammeovirga agarivorans]|uniref:Nitroreductase n=1 Tax=Flammeovirga agarivorans TaxID=2726742 RepID=A0A7X8SMV1_9BACT|nr:nitroreductase family protein [Flammeovirga agarivorans]NLR93086.1 nitroreductase [Flammeovirga agarivorans]
MKKIIINSIKKIITDIDNLLITFSRKFKFTSALYYFLFSRSFYRECQAVLEGRYKYLKNNKLSNSEALLRRNIHRIEKGLIMKPRRKVFALDYIEETVNAFIQFSSNSEIKGTPSYIWFKNVLESYFDAVDLNNEKLSKQFKLFQQLNLSSDHGNKRVPFRRSERLINTISYDQLKKLSLQRRSVRWYTNDKVPHKLIENAVDIAKLSPSACNRQPFYFRVIDDEALLKKVSGIPGGTAGFAHNFQMIIVVIGNLENYTFERDRHLIYIDSSLAIMSFLYGLEVQGLSSCVINWPDVPHLENKMNSVLDLENYERPIALISVGYASENDLIPYSEKKTINELIKYN